jgi:hypothetical protein
MFETDYLFWSDRFMELEERYQDGLEDEPAESEGK